MTIGFDTNNTQQCLIVKVFAAQPTRVRCRVYHAVKVAGVYLAGRPETDYFSHVQLIKGNGIFYVRMPQAPKHVLIEITDCRTNGAAVPESNNNIKWIPFEKGKSWIGSVPLKTKVQVFDYKDKKLQEAIRFFQWLSEYKSILSAGGSVYGSEPTLHVQVHYYDYLVDRKAKPPQILKDSPARIGEETKIIEAAKDCLRKFTVQQTMGIWMHEYGHGYLNTNMADETEADLNALRILIGLGYSRSEIGKVFLRVFDRFPTQSNQRRWNIIRDFLANFEVADLSYANDNYYMLNKV